jgi:hypothetical protein
MKTITKLCMMGRKAVELFEVPHTVGSGKRAINAAISKFKFDISKAENDLKKYRVRFAKGETGLLDKIAECKETVRTTKIALEEMREEKDFMNSEYKEDPQIAALEDEEDDEDEDDKDLPF